MHIDRNRILLAASPSARAVILFGSRARGDHQPDSDTDVLQVEVESQPSCSLEEIAFSCYTLPQLKKMARHGSLFVAHLVTESVPLRDPEDILGQIRAAYIEAPFDYFATEVSWAARLLTDSETRFKIRPLKYQRLALHLARTLVYATALSLGIRTFSMREIWNHLGPDLGPPLPRAGQMDWRRYLEIRIWLQDRLHLSIANEFGSDEALIVNAWAVSRLCVALGLRLLHEGDVLPTYEDTDLWGEMW